MKVRDRDFKDLVWPSFADSMVLNLSIFVFMFVLVSLIMIFLVKDVTENKTKFSNEKSKLESRIKELEKFEKAQNQFVLGVAKELTSKNFKITYKNNKLNIPSDILFDPGEAIIHQSKEKELDKIFKAINQQFKQTTKVKLMIGGHSDDTPINNEYYKDNWSLSSDRARNVVLKFINLGFSKNSIFASGFADTVVPYTRPASNKGSDLKTWRNASRRITIEIHQE